MTHPTLRTLLALAALALATAACGGHEAAHEASDPGTVQAPIASAERIELADTVELQGSVESDRSAAISARVMAMITAVHASAGDHVTRGQLLLEIDPQAAKGQVSQARGAQAQASAALSLAQRNYERFKALASTKAASELELDMARMQYEQAKGAVEQATGAVQAASSVASDSRVTAPFDGRIVQRMVEVGDLAAPGRPLLLVQSDASRRLAVTVSEKVMVRSGLAVGDTVPATIDARPDLGELTGIVEEMTPGSDPMSHSFLVKIGLPAGELATGSAGRARVGVATRTAVAVPADAVIRRGGLELVVLRDDEGRATSRVITTGRGLDDGRVEVLSGLDGGEELLVGLEAVPNTGARVEASR